MKQDNLKWLLNLKLCKQIAAPSHKFNKLNQWDKWVNLLSKKKDSQNKLITKDFSCNIFLRIKRKFSMQESKMSTKTPLKPCLKLLIIYYKIQMKVNLEVSQRQTKQFKTKSWHSNGSFSFQNFVVSILMPVKPLLSLKITVFLF